MRARGANKMKSSILLVALMFMPVLAFANTKLMAVSDFSINSHEESTQITNSASMQEKRPDLLLGCFLKHNSVSYPRVIKGGSKFSIKKVGSPFSINYATAPLPQLKEQVENRFGVKVGPEVDTHAKLEKFLSERYGAKLQPGIVYKLRFTVVSEKSGNEYLIECSSGTKAFTAAEALDAIAVSNVLTYDPEF
jgi:hypothetical protein